MDARDVDPETAAQVEAMRPPHPVSVGLRAVAVAVVVGLISAILCGFSLASPVFSCAVVLVVAMIDGAVLPPNGRLPRGTWACFFTSCLAWSGLGWARLLDRPIVVRGFHCGTSEAVALFVLPFLAALVAAVIALAVRIVVTWAPGAVVWIAKTMAVSAGLVAVVLAPIAVVRSVTRPEPAQYLDRLPVLATIETLGSIRHGVGDLAISHDCNGPDAPCAILVGSRAAAADAELPLDLTFVRQETLVVRHDAAAGIYVIRGERTGNVAAYSAAGTPIAISPRDVAASLAPPREITVLAVIAALLAIGGGLWARRRRLAARRLLGAVEAHVDDAGWLSFAPDAKIAPVRVADVRSGPVLVLGTRVGDAYRGAAAADVVPTSHREVRASLRAFEEQLASSLALAIPTAILPLIVAALHGLVL